ncbi:MAG: family N-acetyltransferase [Nevskia sp.]|nr:family N-acetyltransferase [Nevskia sp.]
MIQIVEISSNAGVVLEPAWLARAEAVHRQLRPQLDGDYPAQMQRVFAAGTQMAVAADGERVLGVTLWRTLLNTASGQVLYVDDLVTDADRRSGGVGRALLSWLEARARQLDCVALTLDSGTQRLRAHAFYFREGMHIASFHFSKRL